MPENKPKPIPALSQKDIDRFWSKVDKTPGHGPNGDCWLWTGGRQERGYGLIYLNRRTFSAHRVSYVLHHAEPPAEKPKVLHACDNPPCVNPEHLWVGTDADNMHDKIKKGRQATGERAGPKNPARGDRNGSRKYPERLRRGDNHPARLSPEKLARGESAGLSKLTEEKVHAILDEYTQGVRQARIAKKYGVSQTAIWAIVKKRTWKHVT